MNNLDGFLKKFKTALGVLNLEKSLISETVSTVLGIQLPEGAITLKNNVVHVGGSPTLRSQIFLKKNQILESFKKHPELKKITDIR